MPSPTPICIRQEVPALACEGMRQGGIAGQVGQTASES